MVTIKSRKEIEQMREACKLTAQVHEVIKNAIRPGISTYELDQIAEKFIRENGGIPAEKNYPSGIPGVPDFPGSICASVNDEIIHGIPSKKVILKDGDVISIDLVVLKNGFNGDAARTYIVGEPNSVEMHEDPGIPNYGKPGRGMRLEPGMTICIEPMVIAGNREILELDDGWTIVSEDGSNGAHYENTILITENEPEILTKI